MSARVIVPSQFRAARVAALQRELMDKQTELVELLEQDELVVQAAFVAEVDAIATAPTPAPKKTPPPRRRRRRRRAVAEACDADIQAARRAAKRAGMLTR